VLLVLSACAASPPPEGGVEGCPSSPNCVSTAAPAEDAVHHIEPLTFDGDIAVAIARMRAIVEAMPRTALVESTPTRLRYTFTSRIWRFVDDVDLVFSPGRIDIRSASRVGYGDMGANRARVDALRAAWEAR
jgi:uncharacterized protein (DUF1499 family)